LKELDETPHERLCGIEHRAYRDDRGAKRNAICGGLFAIFSMSWSSTVPI